MSFKITHNKLGKVNEFCHIPSSLECADVVARNMTHNKIMFSYKSYTTKDKRELVSKYSDVDASHLTIDEYRKLTNRVSKIISKYI